MNDKNIDIKNKLDEGLTFIVSRFKEQIKNKHTHKHDKCFFIKIIIEPKEFEKTWNAFRLSVTAKKTGHEVNVFLMMGEAVECEGLTHEKYNVEEQLKKLARKF